MILQAALQMTSRFSEIRSMHTTRCALIDPGHADVDHEVVAVLRPVLERQNLRHGLEGVAPGPEAHRTMRRPRHVRPADGLICLKVADRRRLPAARERGYERDDPHQLR